MMDKMTATLVYDCKALQAALRPAPMRTQWLLPLQCSTLVCAASCCAIVLRRTTPPPLEFQVGLEQLACSGGCTGRAASCCCATSCCALVLLLKFVALKT